MRCFLAKFFLTGLCALPLLWVSERNAGGQTLVQDGDRLAPLDSGQVVDPLRQPGFRIKLPEPAHPSPFVIKTEDNEEIPAAIGTPSLEKPSPPLQEPVAEPRRDASSVSPPARKAPISLLPKRPLAVRGSDQTISSAKSGIQTSILRPLSIDSLGVLENSERALRRDIWRGAPRTRIAELIESLPVETESPVLRDLLVRLLLSPLDVPITESDPDKLASVSDSSLPRLESLTQHKATGQKEGDLLALRLRALLKMGEFEGSRKLIELTPPMLHHPQFDQLALEAALLRHDDDLACRLQVRLVQLWTDPFLDRVAIWCALRDGAFDKASSHLSLVRELGIVDASFAELVHMPRMNDPKEQQNAETGEAESVNGSEWSVPSGIVAFKIALLKGRRLTLKGRVGSELALRRALVGVTALAPLERIAVAEDLLSRDGLALRQLTGLYWNMDLQGIETGLRLELPDLPDPLLHAWAYKSLGELHDNSERAALIRLLLSDLSDMKRWRVRQSIVLGNLRSIPPRRDLVWLAPQATRALLAAGEWRLASDWTRLAIEEMSESTPLIQPVETDSIWGLARLARLPVALDAFRIERLYSLVATREAGVQDGDKKLSRHITAILRAVDDRRNIHDDLPKAIRASLVEKRYGEALARALRQINGRRVAQSDAGAIETLLRVLLAMSLHEEASRLAIEIALDLAL